MDPEGPRIARFESLTLMHRLFVITLFYVQVSIATTTSILSPPPIRTYPFDVKTRNAASPETNFQPTHEIPRPRHITVCQTDGTKSHARPMLAYAQVLADRGHHVTYLTYQHFRHYASDYSLAPTMNSTTNESNAIHFASLGTSPLLDQSAYISNYFGATAKATSTLSETLLTLTGSLAYARKILYETSYRHALPTLKRYFEQNASNVPDLFINDFFSPACIDMAHHLNVPQAVHYPLVDTIETGLQRPFIPGIFSLLPIPLHALTYVQRLVVRCVALWVTLMHGLPFMAWLNRFRTDVVMATLRTDHYDTSPTYQRALVLVNGWDGLVFPRDMAPNQRLIGPLLPRSFDALPADLAKRLDDAQARGEGVVYVAFGSAFKPTPRELTLLLRTLHDHVLARPTTGHQPATTCHVVWAGLTGLLKAAGLDPGTASPQPPHINNTASPRAAHWSHPRLHALAWAPQRAILQHPATRLFVTHGGLESVTEACEAGVPMVVVPMGSDQRAMAMLVARRGLGIHVPRHRLRQATPPSHLTYDWPPCMAWLTARLMRCFEAHVSPMAAMGRGRVASFQEALQRALWVDREASALRLAMARQRALMRVAAARAPLRAADAIEAVLYHMGHMASEGGKVVPVAERWRGWWIPEEAPKRWMTPKRWVIVLFIGVATCLMMRFVHKRHRDDKMKQE